MTYCWIDLLPGLAGLDEQGRALLLDLHPTDIPGGRILFSPGTSCAGFALVLSGVIRVGTVSESGRSLVLYRVTTSDICIQTTLCLMAGLDYTAEGVAETSVQLIVIPAARFEMLIGQSPVFRRFVFARFGARLHDISQLLETVAFVRIDARLARTLLALANADGRIAMTHQALADEMGTAREVVSRQLEAFARAGLVQMMRGEVKIIDRNAVEVRASVT